MSPFQRILQILGCIAMAVFMFLFFGNYFAIKIEEEDINGVLVRKYVDTANHYSQRIIIKEPTGEKETTITGHDYGLWDYLQPGDSIIKPQGTNKFKIKRDTAISYFYVVERKGILNF